MKKNEEMMKKVLIRSIVLIVIFILAALIVNYFVGSGSELKESCEESGGEFLDEYNECVGISEESCSNLGGSFEECASACRHNPDSVVCTMQCVRVCSFD